MSGTRFSNDGLRRLHDAMSGYVDRGDVPGLVTLVARGDEVHVDAMGTHEFGAGPPMRRETVFRVSSLTKPVTAAATMILVDDGALRLDEPVDRLLPELADRRVLRRLESPLDDAVPAARPITVGDLLTFRMGIGIVLAPPGTYPIQVAMEELELGQGPPQPSTPPGPDEWIRRLGTLPLVHQPGERWMYSTPADVLGVLISRASGRPFEEFLRERMLGPLGMRDTGFSVPAADLGRLPTEYWTDPSTGETVVYDEADGGQWSHPPAFPGGGAGLVSTVDDFLALGRMLLDRGRFGGERILSEASAAAMATDQLTPEQKAAPDFFPAWGAKRGWGFGVAVHEERDSVGRNAGSFGWDGGLGTTWYSDPQANLLTLLFTQRAWESPNPPPVCLDFWNGVYRALQD